MRNLIYLILLAAGTALPIYSVGPESRIEQGAAISPQIDRVFEYFAFLGTELKIDEEIQNQLFAPDFAMIINGKTVVQGRDALKEHFELLFSQVTRIDLEVYEKIIAKDKAVMRYDVLKPGKSASKVIAIFKFRDGLVYEMNEVVHSADPKAEIDYTSR